LTRAAIFLFAAFMAWTTGAFAQNGASTPTPSTLPQLIDARVTTTPQRARLVLDLSRKTDFATYVLAQPDRIVVEAGVGEMTFAQPEPAAGTGLVSGYKVEMASLGRARVTISLTGPAQVQQAYVLDALSGQPARLVVDLIGDAPAHFARQAEIGAKALAKAPGEPLGDNSTPPGASNVASTARPLVIIDPGHGGIDSGAEARDGTMEKQVVLAFSLELQDLLEKAGRVDVALTRNDDEYLTLGQRVSLARKNHADLLISIHADTFRDSTIRGASVYTRDPNATDALDKVLADTENKSSLLAGLAPANSAAQVVNVLVDLMQRQTRRLSFLAAKSIIDSLDPSVRLRRIPQRKADFFVLDAPDVPSVLVELGFLSNATDAKDLQSSQWRDRVAAALARGIVSYFDGLEQR
jgi:N-acetylmuramoyl-L-alanine amidase